MRSKNIPQKKRCASPCEKPDRLDAFRARVAGAGGGEGGGGKVGLGARTLGVVLASVSGRIGLMSPRRRIMSLSPDTVAPRQGGRQERLIDPLDRKP